MTRNKLQRFSVILSLIFCVGLTCQAAQDEVRMRELFNFGWRYAAGDHPGAERTDFDDSRWQVLDVPHDGSIGGEFEQLTGTWESGFRPRHVGWYRKTFPTPCDAEGKHVELEFEGVYRAAEVWINGTRLGKHLNGYTGFSYDITPYLHYGNENNVVAVRYDNTYISSRWYTGEGIYRNVWLTVTHPVRIAENGVYIVTPAVGKDKARVDVQTEVVNRTDTCQLTTLRTVFYAPDGRELKTLTSVVPIAAGDTYTFRNTAELDNPELWDVDSPSLYMAESYVIAGESTVDHTSTRFGIRTVDFTPDQGFLLNGRKVFLKGVNLHHDLGPLGSAFFEKGMRRRLEMLKEMGCNAVRLAHNPYDETVLDLCDEMGLLVFDECFDKWDTPTWNHYGPDTSFDEHWRNDLEWFIRRDRNHPSVFIWSVGNEVFDKGTCHRMESYFVPTLREMVDFVHRLEPSRKVTCGLFPHRPEESPVPMAFLMDVVSDNYMSAYYEKDHERFPQLIFLQSETSTRNDGEDFFTYDHSYTCGQFYWGAFDYFGESFKGWPLKGWDGIIDWCGFWKPRSYFIQSLYSDEPMVKIATRSEKEVKDAVVWNNVALNWQEMSFSWNWTPGQSVQVVTATTAEEVELFVNGQSAGVKRVKDFPNRKITWQVDFEPGTLRAVARTQGRVVATDELKTAGKPYAVALSVDSARIAADGMDLAYVTARVVDKEGVEVPYADHLIRFSVKGEGRMAAVGNADLYSNETFDSDRRKAYRGRCQLIVRSTTQPGKIEINATADGLKRATLTVDSVRLPDK